MSGRHFFVGFLLLAPVSTALSFRLPAQENPCLTRTVPVNVTTNDYRVVSGLTSANFRGKFRGHPVEIISVKYDTGPRRIVILLDASGSMKYAWEAELGTAQNIVLQAPPKDSFAVLAFGDGTSYMRIGFGKDPKDLVNGLGRMTRVGKAYGKTAMLDALLEAVNMSRPLRMGDALLLISDGGDNASRSDPAQSQSVLLSSGVRLFALIMGKDLPDRERTPEEAAGPGGLRDLINAVGGDSLGVASGGPVNHVLTDQGRKNMASAASALGREFSEFYAVEVKLPEAVDKPRGWQLEVVGDIPEKHYLRVVYPHRLAPCQ